MVTPQIYLWLIFLSVGWSLPDLQHHKLVFLLIGLWTDISGIYINIWISFHMNHIICSMHSEECRQWQLGLWVLRQELHMGPIEVGLWLQEGISSSVFSLGVHMGDLFPQGIKLFFENNSTASCVTNTHKTQP